MSLVTQTLYCKQCRTRLSRSIVFSDHANAAQPGFKFDLRKPVCASGYAVISQRPAPWITGHACPVLRSVPQYWLNPADLEPRVNELADGEGMQGCCGPTGVSGPNQVCRHCKAKVGVLQDDCITPRVFIPDQAATVWSQSDAEHLSWDT